MTAQDAFTDEQVQAMKDRPEAVARKILGPKASEAAVVASARMVKLLGDAFALAGPGGRVGMETTGRNAGNLIRAIHAEDPDD